MNDFRDDLPTITILTPCLNPGPYIVAAVDSVRRQNYPKIEHIILDAVSSDGSLSALKETGGLRIVSEPDDGSHDAMNKGLRIANGEIIGFLNTDDFYGDRILLDVANAFAADPALDIVAVGTVVFEEGASGDRRLLAARDHSRADSLWFSELAFGASGFNGRFFRRRVFERFGNFDVKYDFSADRDFLNRLALSDAKRLTLPRFGYFYRSHLWLPHAQRRQAQCRSVRRRASYPGLRLRGARTGIRAASLSGLACIQRRKTVLSRGKTRTARYRAHGCTENDGRRLALAIPVTACPARTPRGFGSAEEAFDRCLS